MHQAVRRDQYPLKNIARNYKCLNNEYENAQTKCEYSD